MENNESLEAKLKEAMMKVLVEDQGPSWVENSVSLDNVMSHSARNVVNYIDGNTYMV